MVFRTGRDPLTRTDLSRTQRFGPVLGLDRTRTRKIGNSSTVPDQGQTFWKFRTKKKLRWSVDPWTGENASENIIGFCYCPINCLCWWSWLGRCNWLGVHFSRWRMLLIWFIIYTQSVHGGNCLPLNFCRNCVDFSSRGQPSHTWSFTQFLVLCAQICCH